MAAYASRNDQSRPDRDGRPHARPDHIAVRGARVHNLRNVDIDIPLGQLVGIAGVSGSGKSSLALGVLYAEGSRRYLDALSTYTRRRISQSTRAAVDLVEHVPAAIALRQRPGVPSVRSTFGTSTELLNHLRLLFSRVGTYRCPSCGHDVPPSMAVALDRPMSCPHCGHEFAGIGAEELAFNSAGACPTCQGTGVSRVVDESTLVPDESLTIDEGAVKPWGSLMWSLMKDIARDSGVRTDVPFRDLTPKEREFVLHGPAEKHHLLYHNEKTNAAGEMDFTYYSATYSVENALARVKDEKGMKRVERFLKTSICPDCHGTRLSAKARSVRVRGMDLGEVSALTLDELGEWLDGVVETLPGEVRDMGALVIGEMREPMARLRQLGLGYLSLDRASSTLSTGERQRVQLTRAVRSRTTGVLYVLDEPSIGLHPSNVDGLLGVVDDLLADGNSVVMVDHDTRVLRESDWLVEVGPGSGKGGGRIVASGPVADVANDPSSHIGPFLTGTRRVRGRERASADRLFDDGRIALATNQVHTVRPLDVSLPVNRLTCVTGVSGSGKTTLVLECLVPALQAACSGEGLPGTVRSLDAPGIERVSLIDATPIGTNVRSTVATYSGVLDDLRRAFAATPDAKAAGLKAGAFSYNTGKLRCPECDGTGTISLDVQFLPDVEVVCPTCHGSRYAEAAGAVRLPGVGVTLPELLALGVDEALATIEGEGGDGKPKLPAALRRAVGKLRTLSDLGLGYLTLGEATPALSGGEAQRLKLASEMGRRQDGTLFVFDEPTIGLHPLDVETLLGVLQRLIDAGATVVVIEHDLDMIANADYVIDLGPGGGERGGRIVAAGTPTQVSADPESVTGRYLAAEWPELTGDVRDA